MTATSLVLLHGWGLGPRVWSCLRDALPPGVDLITPELPGHGDTPLPSSRDIAAWSNALLPRIPDRAVLCGWSLGGLIAIDLAHRHPEKIARLILIGTSPCFVSRPSSDASAWRHGLDGDTVAGFMTSFNTDPAATLSRFIALQTYGDARRRVVSADLNAALALLEGNRASSLAEGLRLLENTDLRAITPTLHQPVRIIHGARDALMPVAAAKWLAGQISDARLTLFDDCGHAPFLSRPAACAKVIAEVLND